MNDVSHPNPTRHWLRFFATTVACLAILAASAAAIVVINRTEPTAQTINATRKSAALVETIVAERGDFSPRLTVLGTVEPAQDIFLSPRVQGQVIELAPSFTLGGRAREGEMLLRIDPADFENSLSIRESELAQVEASLAIEEGRQILAKKELALLEGTIEDADRELVLRVPQLASIKAELSAAKAAVERAKLDLERTRVLAPFDAQVLSLSANIGSQVAPGDELAQLVGIDQYWVLAAVPVRSLRWIKFPEGDEDGSLAVLRDDDSWGPNVHREARVSRMIGTLDQQTRLARVLVTVSDPLGLTSGEPALILDTLIDVEIVGRPIQDVVRLPREYLRENDSVWVMNEGKLEIREATVEFRDADYAYIRDGLAGGEQVVTTTLATVANGVGLRRVSEATDTSEPADEEVAD